MGGSAVSSGQTINGAVISGSSEALGVDDGGIANGTVVEAGGVVNVFGGSAFATIISSGGVQYTTTNNLSGIFVGVDTDTVVYGGGTDDAYAPACRSTPSSAAADCKSPAAAAPPASPR